MTGMNWLRRLFQRGALTRHSETEWNVVVGGRTLARLRLPEPEDMFWTSFEIVPATQPADSRLMDDSFWASDAWRVVRATTGHEEGPVIASSTGLDRLRHRVRLRGIRG